MSLGRGSSDDVGETQPIAVRAYWAMRRLRAIDQRMVALQRQGRIAFYGSARGQEAVAVGAGLAMESEDWVFPALREQGIMLMRGFPLRLYVAQLLGSAEDLLRGRQMPSHAAHSSVRHVSWSSTVGSQLPQAVGTAWAMRARKSTSIAMAFCGDGATSTSDFHSAMAFAGARAVPCVIVCQNNQYAISLPRSRQTASETLAVKARAYGLPGVVVDGNDVLAVMNVLSDACARARAGQGSTLVEAVTYRMGPHSTSDDPTRYRSREEEQSWERQDPILRSRAHLALEGLVTESDDEQFDAEFASEISRVVDEAELVAPPTKASLFEDVYSEIPKHLASELEELQKVVPAPSDG